MSTLNETFTTEDSAPAPVGLPFQKQLMEFVDLELERRQHEERLKIISERTGQLEKFLIEELANMSMSNAKVHGLTVYIRTDRYVSRKSEASNEQVCAALRDCGLGYMVSDGYNASSLKSKVKEYQDQGLQVPENLAGLLNIGEVARLATRK